MVNSASVACDLRHEKQQLLEAMLVLTQQAISPLPVEDVIVLLDERTALMQRVTTIDGQLAQLEAPPAPEADTLCLRRCLEALVDQNQRLLQQLTTEKDALLDQLLILRRPSRP